MSTQHDSFCIQAATDVQAAHMANPPVYQGSTILYRRVAELMAAHAAYANGAETLTYGRKGTPTSLALTEALASLEGGHRAYLTPSGLAAVSVALISHLSAGDHVLMVDSAYTPTRELCDGLLRRMGVQTTYYDPCIGDGIAALMQENTRVVYLESPGSITFEIQDVPAITAAARARGIVSIIDNTWATALNFNAFAHGVDIVVQAVTKYIAGHSDVLMGAVIANEATYLAVRRTAHELGQFAGGNDISLVLRGLRTLPTRLRAQEAAALSLAQWFEAQQASHPHIRRVIHPALPAHPQHALFKRDFTGSSGLFAVEFAPQLGVETINHLVESLQHFGIGYSWGGFESLALPIHPHRIRNTRSATPAPEGSIVRLQIGLEAVADLRDDLAQALARL